MAIPQLGSPSTNECTLAAIKKTFTFLLTVLTSIVAMASQTRIAAHAHSARGDLFKLASAAVYGTRQTRWRGVESAGVAAGGEREPGLVRMRQ